MSPGRDEGSGRSPAAGPPDRVLVAALLAIWLGSRLVYSSVFGLRFSSEPLDWYIQYVDPELLRTRLLESVLHLRDQPPGFNLFLGLVLKATGGLSRFAFWLVYGILGGVLTVTLWRLMRRLSVAPAVAFALTALFAASPVSALYENWLFYAYPVAVLLCVAALALHRFVASGRTSDGLGFFLALAAIPFLRGTFHFAWFLAIAAGLALARAVPPRALVTAAALPALLLSSLYARNYLTFGEWFSGRLYRDLNYAEMVLQGLPAGERARLVERGELSPIVELSIYQPDLGVYDPFLGEIERTGIPVLDMEQKSNGEPNWQSLKMQQVGRRMAEAAAVASRHEPEAWRRSVAANVARYFQPADQSFPFLPGNPSAAALAPPRRLHALLLGQRAVGEPAWLVLAGLPLLVLYGLGFLVRRAWRGELAGPDGVTVAFLLLDIAYLAAVTILFSSGDHNRYRFEVAPFYFVLAGMAVSAALQRLADRRAGIAGAAEAAAS